MSMFCWVIPSRMLGTLLYLAVSVMALTTRLSRLVMKVLGILTPLLSGLFGFKNLRFFNGGVKDRDTSMSFNGTVNSYIF